MDTAQMLQSLIDSRDDLADNLTTKGITSTNEEPIQDLVDKVLTIETEPSLQNKTVTPSNTEQSITADAGYDGLGTVTVNTDADLVATNIKKDVNIFGVTGSLEAGSSDEGWTPNSTWWDIKTILDNDTEDYPAKAIYLFNDSDKISSTGLGYNKVVTSDGSTYTSTNKIHTWDTTQDKACYINGAVAYKTRYFIYYYNSTNYTPNIAKTNILYIYFKNSNCNKNNFGTMKMLEAIALDNSTLCYNSTSTSDQFSGCYSLRKVDLFDTSQVTEMNSMFRDCGNLTDVPLFNMSEVTTATYMFYYCHNLKTLPNFNWNKMEYLQNCFYSCYSLKEFPIINLPELLATDYLFYGCTGLETIKTTSMPKANGYYCFASNPNSYSGDKLKYLPNIGMTGATMFQNYVSGRYSLNTIDTLDFTKVTTANNMFNTTNNVCNILNAYNINVSLVLSSIENLSRESMLVIFNALVDRNDTTQLTLSVGFSNRNKMTTEEKAIVTNKNWILN